MHIDTTAKYTHAVPSIDKDTVYIYNGHMCDIFLHIWEEYPEQNIEIVDDITPYRRRYLTHLITVSK